VRSLIKSKRQSQPAQSPSIGFPASYPNYAHSVSFFSTVIVA
jgi:hypothetical protein